jgi:hypothetical protein
VSKSEGLKGALRGSGLGPCIDAVILRAEVGAISVEDEAGEEDGISRYAEPEAEGMMEVCRTIICN